MCRFSSCRWKSVVILLIATGVAVACVDQHATGPVVSQGSNADVALTPHSEANLRASRLRIAFASNRNGNREIYVMMPDGSRQTRLTHHPASDGEPTWSPDGRRVAFGSNRDGNSEIYIMEVRGNGLRAHPSEPLRLTTDPAADFNPSWSPDGQRIAFASRRDRGMEVYVMNADGSEPTRLTNCRQIFATCFGPTWSPDGQRIAFVSQREGSFAILAMDADGSGETLLAWTTTPSTPSWSPDGRKIAFARRQELWVMNADGSEQMHLTDMVHGGNSNPAWSPDGGRIAFDSNRDAVNSSEIYVINVDGSGEARLTFDASGAFLPSWGALGR